MGGDEHKSDTPLAVRARRSDRSLPSLLKLRQQIINDLAVLDADIRDEYHLQVASQYGIKLGSIVQDIRGFDYRVCAIEMPLNLGERPLVTGQKLMKRKGVSVNKRQLYGNWRKK